MFPGTKGRDLRHRDVRASERLAVRLTFGKPRRESLACRLTRRAWSKEKLH
jgi:hypothetical protein